MMRDPCKEGSSWHGEIPRSLPGCLLTYSARRLGGIVAVYADVAPIDLDADKGLVKGDAQTLSEINDRVAAVRPDSADKH